MSASGTVAADHLRAFIERIERLEEEKRTIADDIKDIYAEAKSNGFDTKAIRTIIKLRKKDQAEREEEEAILDTYMAALGMLPLFDTDRSYADAKGRTESGPEVQVRGEGYETSSEGTTDELANTPAGSVSDAIPSANPPSASAPHTGLSSFPEHEVDASSGSIQSPAPTSSQADDSAGTFDPSSPNVPVHNSISPEPSSQVLAKPDAGAAASGTISVDDSIPAFLKDKPRLTAADYRPHCQHPDACGSSGLHHCYTCRKAIEEQAEGVAA